MDSYYKESDKISNKKIFLGEFIGGSACNTAYFLKSLLKGQNVPVHLVSVVGNDENAERVFQIINFKHFSTRFITQLRGKTGSTSIILQSNGMQEIKRIPSVTNKLHRTIDNVFFQEYFQEANSLIYMKASLNTAKILSRFQLNIFACDISGFLNESDKNFQKNWQEIFQNQIFKIPTLFGNETEFLQLGNTLNLISETDKINLFSIEKEKKLRRFMEKVLAAFNSERIIIKQGNRGACCGYFDQNQLKIIYDQPPKVMVVDTTGAGDAFNAAFMFGLLLEKKISICLKLANKLGSLNCTCLGAQELKISKKELIAKIDQ